MTEIIPAIMPTDWLDLVAKAQRVSASGALWAQIDIMDGVFVPSRSWPYEETENFSIERKGEVLKNLGQLPEKHTLQYEIDLMTCDADEYYSEWLALDAQRYFFHWEALKNPDTFFLSEPVVNSRKSGIEIGIAVGAGFDPCLIFPFLSIVDCVQVMGIDKIGYQGQPFDVRSLSVLRKIRAENPHIPLSVDGAVSNITAPQYVASGANRLTSGSTLFQADDMAQKIEELQKNADSN